LIEKTVNSKVDVLLASQSPRRQELLMQIGVRFAVVQVSVPEEHQPGEPPEDYVLRLARAKAAAGSRLRPELPVLGADTVVVWQGQILEKPRDRAHALAMLQQLSGNDHQVLTGIALCHGERQSNRVVRTQMRFRPIAVADAERYWDTGEPRDKAGGYGIQGLGAVFVEHLAGSYSNVVGLPLAETAQMFGEFGISVWAERRA
jgi:septum formation protein